MTSCNVCRSPKIHTDHATQSLNYKGNVIPITVYFSTCRSCGFEFINKDQILQNDSVVRIKKAAFDKRAA